MHTYRCVSQMQTGKVVQTHAVCAYQPHPLQSKSRLARGLQWVGLACIHTDTVCVNVPLLSQMQTGTWTAADNLYQLRATRRGNLVSSVGNGLIAVWKPNNGKLLHQIRGVLVKESCVT